MIITFHFLDVLFPSCFLLNVSEKKLSSTTRVKNLLHNLTYVVTNSGIVGKIKRYQRIMYMMAFIERNLLSSLNYDIQDVTAMYCAIFQVLTVVVW
jgi:preprotein translocase subunit YajC